MQPYPLVTLLLVNQDHKPSTLYFASSRESVFLQRILFFNLHHFLQRGNRECRLGPELAITSQRLLLGDLSSEGQDKKQPCYQAEEPLYSWRLFHDANVKI
ncbi:MAG: hypothetical protein CMP29_09875 [Roseibacillus sp.]|nr:hypothetical protein [Roseibacillus sp.]